MRRAATLAILAALAAPAAAGAEVRASVIGDSVLAAVDWPAHHATVGELQVDAGVCRRIVEPSCPYDGGRVPTVLDLVGTMGPRLGSTVVVEAGYNEPPATFGAAVRTAVDALAAAGVRQVLWLSLHEALPQFAAMNATLAAVAAERPGVLRILDWNALAAGHPDWFQGDGVHLQAAGAAAIVGLIDRGLAGAGPAPPPPAPSGFHEARPLEPLASFVAGKPATVYCADSDAAWTAWAQSEEPVTPMVGGGESELPPSLCSALAAAEPPVAATLALIRAGLRQRGSRADEDVACGAIHLLPRVAVRYLGVRPGRDLRALMARAWPLSACTPGA